MKYPAKKTTPLTRFHGAKQAGPTNPPFYWHYVIYKIISLLITFVIHKLLHEPETYIPYDTMKVIVTLQFHQGQKIHYFLS